jgi:hypothetical protein
LERQCANSSDYLWLRGLIARRFGDLAAASIWFEASLLREPGRAGALLDFALTRDALGDLLSAQTIYRNLLDDYSPDDNVRSLINGRLADVEAKLAGQEILLTNTNAVDSLPIAKAANKPATDSVHWFGLLGVSLGYDNNLNSASPLRAFNLMIEDQLISLEIPERDQPQAGYFRSISSRLERRALSSDGNWGVSLRQMLRQPESSRFRTGAIEIAADMSRKIDMPGLLSGDFSVLLAKQWLGVENALVARSTRVAFGYEPKRRFKFENTECSTQLALEFEQRRYPDRPVLDGDVYFHGVKVLCEVNNKKLELFGRSGVDATLDGIRAGGDQFKKDWGMAWVGKFSNQSLRLHWFVSASNDKNPYNSLIENNKIRSSMRLTRGVEWSSQHFGPGVEPFLSYERTDQVASIALFAYSGWQVNAGLRWHF